VRRPASTGGLVLVAFALSGAAGAPGDIALFDGASLAGWHVSAASGHSAPSGHRAGGDWRVEDGAIVGRQDPPGNGGLLVSDREFGDVEITLETADEWDSDSGLFLRTTPEGAAYQVMIDLYPGGTAGGIWGEALPETLDDRRFVFGESPAGTPWHPGWNTLRARITGNPPHITTWLNGEIAVDFQDAERRLAAIATTAARFAFATSVPCRSTSDSRAPARFCRVSLGCHRDAIAARTKAVGPELYAMSRINSRLG
jgi:hypothetical protein